MTTRRQLLVLAVAAALQVLTIGAGALAINVAPNGVASQSSIDDGGGWEGVPERAIDGDRNGDYFHGSVTHTDNGDPDPDPELYEWWEVALDARYSIQQIIVFNRTDCCSERLIPFRLSLFDGINPVFVQDVDLFVEDIGGPDISGMSFTLSGQLGDRVRVQLRHQDWLSVAEVEVIGEVPTPVRTPSWGRIKAIYR